MDTGVSALLLLADGRFPSGGHAHSSGLEAAATLEGVRNLASLESFLAGRLATAGAVAAAFTAAACTAVTDAAHDRLGLLDAEFAARTPSPALRTASTRLGRQLLRAGRAVWPHTTLASLAAEARPGPHQPVALGGVAAAAGLSPAQAALAAAHEAVLSPATAAVRLLGLDPFAVHALLARLAERVTAVGEAGAAHANTAPAELPSYAAPLLDIAAEAHATWEVRLFAS
jgi:urease accessory protein